MTNDMGSANFLEQRALARKSSPGSLERQARETLAVLREWRRRVRARSELRSLTDRELWDFGVTRSEAMGEGCKPFWRE